MHYDNVPLNIVLLFPHILSPLLVLLVKRTIYHFRDWGFHATKVPVGIILNIAIDWNRSIRTRNAVTHRMGRASFNFTVIGYSIRCGEGQIT